MTLADWINVGLAWRRRLSPSRDRRLLERKWLREERGHKPVIAR